MFIWGILFLLIALIAATLGFGTLSGTAALMAKIVFILAVGLFILNLIRTRISRR
ncbi:MAG: DUF1328 domain-containing protein [Desulfovibrionaceae bacterium]|nr:DUF1328 domain-containing protein [Desulfovibrionaceae bacterium]